MTFSKTISILIFFILILVSCTSKNINVHKFNPQNNDFSYLKKALKGKRIVALGESSHGCGDLMSLKVEMVKYLHKELGYELFLLEAGMGDVNLAWQNIQQIDSLQLRKSTVFGNFMSEQMAPLFNYIKNQSETEKKLIFAGFESQRTGKTFEYKLMHIIKRIEPKVIQDSVKQGLNFFYTMHAEKNDKILWQKHKDRFLSSVHLAQAIIKDNKEDILELKVTQTELDIINRTLEGYVKMVDFSFGEYFTKGLAIKDRLMAENVIFILDKLYPNKKAIIWGHNGHIENLGNSTNKIKWMGHYLKEKYKDEYFSIGMYVKKGAYYQHWAKTNSPFDIADDSYIEGMLTTKYGKNVFVNLPDYTNDNKEWQHQSINSFEPECGGDVHFIPARRFNAILLLNETKPPVFKNYR
ncbi:MAG: erythromycin esterase family protein [Saprospiraceae bacterium]